MSELIKLQQNDWIKRSTEGRSTKNKQDQDPVAESWEVDNRDLKQKKKEKIQRDKKSTDRRNRNMWLLRLNKRLKAEKRFSQFQAIQVCFYFYYFYFPSQNI